MSDLFLLLSFLMITIIIVVVFVLAIREAWRNNNKRIQDELAWEKENKEKNKGESKNEPTLLQKLRKKFNNNKIFNYVGIISVALGIIGWFVAGIILGIIALVFAIAAKKDKQRLAILGIIIGIIDICAGIFIIFVRGGFSDQSIAQIITAGLVGVGWQLISESQRKEAERKYQMNKSKREEQK